MRNFPLASLILWLGLTGHCPAADFNRVNCEGVYRHHLQGICTNEKDAIYWSFTTMLVKTDPRGRVLKTVPVSNHHGDLCHCDGKLYVAVNFGRFNDPEGNADSWVYVYDAADLSFVAKHTTPEIFHGAGGIAHHDKRFVVVGGLPEGVEENYAYEYDSEFKFVKKHVIKSGYTRLGIQTAGFNDGRWWFGCYSNNVLVMDDSFKLVGKFDFDCGLGIVRTRNGRFLIGRGGGTGEKRTGSALVARVDEEMGLVIQSEQERELNK